MEAFTISIKSVEEGVGFSMSDEVKNEEYPASFEEINPWAGRWGEYYKLRQQQMNASVNHMVEDSFEEYEHPMHESYVE